MDFRILPIAEEHVVGFWNAVDVVARERKYLSFLEAPPIEGTRKFVLENIEFGNPQFVVLNENRVIGWCDIVRNRSRPVYDHCGTLGCGILPEFRGKGIGKILLQTTIDKAFDRGMTRIEILVLEKNMNAIALYKKLGFKLEGHHQKASRTDDRYENELSMALFCNDAFELGEKTC